MSFKNIKIAFVQVFSKKESYFISIIATILMGAMFFVFTNYESIRGNLGPTHFLFEIILEVLLAIFFGLNIALLWQKLKINSLGSKHAGVASVIGSIFAISVTGCPACALTLVSFIGLAGIFSTLPLFGLELKILGLLLILYSNYYLSMNMFECKRKITKTKKTKKI